MYPVERVLFYQLNHSTPEYFNSVILPELKHSLSHTLLHYLPLAGNLWWPSNSPKPIITFTPNDRVSITVAESNSNFSLVSGNEIREAPQLHSLVLQLMVTDDIASIIALQITFFPSQGFCIGITAHLTVLDGKSSTMFIKSWAYLCKQLASLQNLSLPPELTPFYDRSVIKDPSRLDLLFLNQWMNFMSSGNRRMLTIIKNTGDVPDDLVSTCLIKARDGDSERVVFWGFAADGRSRLDPPIPGNYFGNCVGGPMAVTKARNFMDGNGFSFAVELVSDMLKELEKGILTNAKNLLIKIFNLSKETGKQTISVAGSPRFGVYGVDFGWEKPKKVDILAIDG
ncbi:hypothetical protein PTKIN_Ptkin08bG0068600 [Pterospermum kingtungense]